MSTPVEELKWSSFEFDQMRWHDVRAHAFAAVPDRFELYFDVDYIVEWICPPSRPGPARFRIAPANVVFENVADVNITVESQQGSITISEVGRTKRQSLPGASVESWHWVFKCEEGVISFDASGCQLALRQQPMLSDVQHLDVEHRGLPTFGGLAK
jgi:hypothetical protein